VIVLDLWCFIPVGGEAKRLRPLTQDVSKPCVRFLNRPLVEYDLVLLASQGVRNFIFGEAGFTNYTNLFDQYGEGVGFSAKYGIQPRVHFKHQPNLDDLGSADSYRLNIDYYGVKAPVLVVQGDGLFDIDLADLVRRHEEKGAVITIGLARVDNVEEFGVVELENDNVDDLRIKRFVEKPSWDNVPSNLANAGVYLLSPEVRKIVESEEVKEMMRERKRLDFGYDLIPYIIDQGLPVYGYDLKVWYDVGTPGRYLKAMLDVLHGKLDIRVSEKRILSDRNVWIQGYSAESIRRKEEIVKKYSEHKLSIDGAALIGRHTIIGDYSRIVDANIDNFCILGQNVSIERSAVMDAGRIGDYTQISDSIVGRKVLIESAKESPTYIGSQSVIGNAVHIGKGCKLTGTRIGAGLTIPANSTYTDKILQNYEDVVQLVSPT
jgi:NDP-sugar pyrophosphorylase family protein